MSWSMGLFSLALSAEPAIQSVSPRAIQPGVTTRVIVVGTELQAPLRALSSIPGAELQVVDLQPTQAKLDITVPADAYSGGALLHLACQSAAPSSWPLIVDDLPTLAERQDNHSLATAQPLENPCGVDGTADGAQSDFYKLSVSAGERVAFEVLSQVLQSPMDPVAVLMNAEGEVLWRADDDAAGPDCRFSYRFATAGDYYLELRDNRYAVGGAYRLRVGDFPLLSHAMPLAVQRDQATTVELRSTDGTEVVPAQVAAHSLHSERSINLSGRTPGGRSTSWVPLLVRDFAQVAESSMNSANPANAAAPLAYPIGISGHLSQPQEVDQFALKGVAGEKIRVSARTRSLGLPTLLAMELSDAAGTKVAETSVSDADEWFLEFTFPKDEIYRLQVTDLLRRGGPGFAYWIEIQKLPGFKISIKGDANSRTAFLLEEEAGVFPLDIQVERTGYDGPIQLSAVNHDAPVRLLNSLLPSNVNEARVYVAAAPGWQHDTLLAIQLQAVAVQNPQLTCQISNSAILRAKAPHVISPPAWNDGRLILSGTPSEPFFKLEAPQGQRLAKPVQKHKLAFVMQRLQAEFKENVTLLSLDKLDNFSATAKLAPQPAGQPAGEATTPPADQTNSVHYDLELLRASDVASTPASITLLVYGEYRGRGRMETITVPVEWFDPLTVQLEPLGPALVGKSWRWRATAVREGGDAQPVVLTFNNLPSGLTGPESVTIAAAETSAEFSLQIASDVPTGTQFAVELSAKSSFTGQEFSVMSARVEQTAEIAPSRWEVFPPEITLVRSADRRQIVVTGYSDDDKPQDWTRAARLSSTNSSVVEVRDSAIFPRGDGTAEIQVELAGEVQRIPVTVSHFSEKSRVEFEHEVLPALSKQGCNSGACHGSPSGKGGFRLSLRAFDPRLDQLTLVREDYGRRVNPNAPEQSLLLLKPLMKVTHGGGKQLHESDEAYALLRNWIAQGADFDPAAASRCVRLSVYPATKRVLHRARGGQQIAAVAHWEDGTQRDVTHLVTYESSNNQVATVDGRGRVTPHQRGEAVILVRFLEFIEPVSFMFLEDVPNFIWHAPPPHNYIDELVLAKLRQLQYLPAETCTDAEFLRRVYLDLIGILPSPEETVDFLRDTRTDKRARVIDALLERPEYAKYWALKWGDLLKMTSKTLGDEGVHKYHAWIEQSLRNNLPYDKFARELLTASGSTLANPPANFYRAANDMNECVEQISQIFLGARIQCAKCHNHPFERWTQDNYYGLGVFFQRLERRKTQRPGELFVWIAKSGEVTQPRTGQVMQPWLPTVGYLPADEVFDRRQVLVDWLVDPENPYFARIEANRIWSQFFARGIVDPIDDFRDSNPPTNEPLLDALTKDFVESGYDRKHLIRVILNSLTYQASFRTHEFNRDDTLYFSHQEPRMLGAEQLLDAIDQLTGTHQTLGGLPAMTRATQIPAPDVVKVDFLKVFGQPERSTVCACERSDASNLGMAIELFNGPLIHEKLRDPQNRFRRSMAAGSSLADVVHELYLAGVCRPPSELELATAIQHCQASDDPLAGLEDVCWALLNTDEFLFQH